MLTTDLEFAKIRYKAINIPVPLNIIATLLPINAPPYSFKNSTTVSALNNTMPSKTISIIYWVVFSSVVIEKTKTIIKNPMTSFPLS